MRWLRTALPITTALLILAAVIWWRPAAAPPSFSTDLELPADPPDLFIRTFQQTRYDAAGQPSLYTVGSTFSFYQDSGNSQIQSPTVRLIRDNGPDWTIRSEAATAFSNGDVVFEDDVKVQELSDFNRWELITDWLTVTENGDFVSTPEPVKLTQGPQVATGVGFNADLTTDDPVLTLQSEVAIHYEAD
ncbi:LPS export ABC transporter periplasmic protein LptC [Saccharospirillum mangrovi]|uniref:LPS export ABC transporter periplasmic protein LptC n=1 Tax=Saccharospirillum mangrovi TaxID=2161747 RepID=UPI000D3B7029|nr:LPS export ABC transporter periplasmic protein LptC [Saccharospirillum mangrovi]